jgi:hypothetical protein
VTLADTQGSEAVSMRTLAVELGVGAASLYVEILIASGRYPLLTRVIFDAHAPHDPDSLQHSFDLGLERVLDGLATMLPK